MKDKDHIKLLNGEQERNSRTVVKCQKDKMERSYLGIYI